MKIDPNANAFPLPSQPGEYAAEWGLTVRAEFAKTILAGMLANGSAVTQDDHDPNLANPKHRDAFVKGAVLLADALIAELNKELS